MTKDLLDLPQPKTEGFFGHLTPLGRDPRGFLTRCQREYGEIVPLRFAFSGACFISNPSYIEQVLQNTVLFVKSRGVRSLRTLLGEGLLINEGDSWFRQRRLAQPAFQQKRIAEYGEIMVAYTEKMLSTWQEGETRNIHADMMRLTLNIVMKSIFARDITDDEAQEVAHALDVAMDWFESKRKQGFITLEWMPLPENLRYKSAIQKMDKTIYHLITERRQSGEFGQDLLSMLMQVRDEEDGSQMSDKQLRDEVVTLMLAGHETTANTLSWTWMLLSQYPQVQTKLLAELTEVLDGRSPTVADIPRLSYTNMVIKEAMRLYPPVATMARQATQACEIGGYTVPAGSAIVMSQWVMHRDSRYFDEPEEFKPERWANDLEKQLPRGVYFPFGDGPRVCIGKGFAMMEAVLLLAAIAQQFKISLVPDHPIIPQASITLRPEQGIKVILAKR